MREKLKATLGKVYWSDLRAHAARDAIIVVAEELDILDVGEAVATDDAPRVEGWIRTGRIAKPTAADLERWSAETAAVFESLIVAPFVLVRSLHPREPSN
jgi:hypothetical protein